MQSQGLPDSSTEVNVVITGSRRVRREKTREEDIEGLIRQVKRLYYYCLNIAKSYGKKGRKTP